MPVATIDTFKRILLKPDNVTLEANVVGDSLSFVAGSGITLTANGNLDEITITNSASLGLVTLDNVLLAGNTSTRTATVGRLNVDNIVIDSNAIQFSDSTIQNTAWTGLPTASNSVLGGVKIDASSITINGSVISVPAVATIGQTNGIATLGSDGKLTSAQIPTSLSGAIIFKGTWNATTNTPTLVDGTGQNGWQYAVAVAGTVNLGSGSITFVPGDFIIYNGSIWQKIAANTIAAAGTLTGVTLASGVTASSLTSVGTLINLTVTNTISGNINGNAGTVTNGVYTTDTGTVTNTMLSGSIANTKLTNSSVTIGSTTVALGASSTTLAGLTSVTSTAFVGALTGSISGNAATVTNGVYTTDTGTVTNTMLSGSIANTKLTNSSVTIGSTAVSLGSTVTTFAGLTSVTSTTFVGALTGSISGNAATVTNGVYTTDTGTVTNTMLSGSIANTKLTNSTISGKALGTNLDTLTLNTSGTGLSGSTTYNGSGAATFTVASNATSANTVSAIVARDANGDFSAGTITATITGSVSGNAGTVTNGVYTTGSYADPAWITSLAASKVGLANVTNESKATMFASPTFTGTVSGVTATHVGLGSVTNESKATMFASPTFTGTVSGVTATHVGLGNVANESKATMFASPTFTGTVSGVTKAHVGLGSVENTALSTWAGSTSITSLGTVTVGSAPASDVYAWAKASIKPSYTATEVGLGNVTNESKATMFTNPAIKQTAGAGGITLTSEGGWPAGIQFKSSGGTFAAPTQTGNGYNVLNISAQGYAGDGFTSLGWMEWTSTEVITSNNRGSQLSLYANRVGGPASYGLFWNGEIFDTTQGSIKATGITTGGSTTAGTLTGAWTLTGSISGVTATMVGLGSVTNESKATMFSSPTFTGTANLSTATQSTSTTTGALTVAGGAGIGGNLYVGGGVKLITPSGDKSFSIDAAGYSNALIIEHNGVNGYISSYGTNGDLYIRTGSGKSVRMDSTAASTSTTTGALIVSGGVGIAGNLYVGGDIVATGNITAYSTSDIRLKENIQLIPNALGKLEQIRGVTFDWTAEEISRRGGEDSYFVRKHDVGVIAQEIEMVLPEIVGTRDNGMKAVQYEKLTALLIESVKELSAKVISLEQQLNLLKIK